MTHHPVLLVAQGGLEVVVGRGAVAVGGYGRTEGGAVGGCVAGGMCGTPAVGAPLHKAALLHEGPRRARPNVAVAPGVLVEVVLVVVFGGIEPLIGPTSVATGPR